MKFKFALIFILSLVVLAWFTYQQLTPPFDEFEFTPEFSLPASGGEIVHLNDFKGMPVLVHFWATWCGSCAEEIPELNAFAVAHPEFKVLAVSEDEAGEPAVTQFFKNIKPAFIVLYDRDGRVADKFKNYKVPETYLLDQEGRFIYRFVGAVSWNKPKMIEMLQNKLHKNH